VGNTSGGTVVTCDVVAGGAGVCWKYVGKGECGRRDNVVVNTVAAGVATVVVDDVVGGSNKNDNKGGSPRCKASCSVSLKVVQQCEQRTCGRSGQEIRCPLYAL